MEGRGGVKGSLRPLEECYPQLMSQVLLNLMVNAGQAIEGEGKIVVRTRNEDGWVRISISDYGRGIQPEHRARIFAPGFTTKPVGVGAGLGLTITREIVIRYPQGRDRLRKRSGRRDHLPCAHCRRAPGKRPSVIESS